MYYQGDEAFSNYGELSNEQLLFAYGFTIPENIYDKVAIKFSLTNSNSGNSNNVFYITSGGISGVPQVEHIVIIVV